MKSLKDFKEALKENLLELHWQQWSTLGVSSYVKETKNIIDLEALIISSLLMGNYDKRLLSSCLEWIKNNKEWVSVSRIKQIGKQFFKVDHQLKKSLIPKGLIECISILLTSNTSAKVFEKLNEEHIPVDYKNILSRLEDRGVTVEPVIQKYPLMQLYFRGIFGINARAEILLYLAFEEKGNSNRIAREIYYDQKIVYRILKRWTVSGFTGEDIRKKETLYFLLTTCKNVQKKQTFLPFSFSSTGNVASRVEGAAPFLKTGRESIKKIKPSGHYVNWCRVFYFFSKLLTFASIEPWSKDTYLLSSLFRDVSEEAARIGRYFNIMLPEKNLFKGEDLFSPFAAGLLKMVKKINK